MNIDLLAHGRIGCPMQEVTIGSTSTLPFDLYIHECPSSLEICRVQQIIDGAGVMGNRKVEILPFLVLTLEVTHQRNQFLPERRSQLA